MEPQINGVNLLAPRGEKDKYRSRINLNFSPLLERLDGGQCADRHTINVLF